MRPWRELAKDLAPPMLIRALGRGRGSRIRFVGQHSDWSSALAASHGYGSRLILEKTRDAALLVASGKAAYERDSVLFERVDYSFPVMATLLRRACADGGRLHVLDFGGSLGTSYRQFKAFAPALPGLRWDVVEQREFVECGRAHFENEELRFHESIAAAARHGAPNAVLLSGVLQYLENPRDVIGEVTALAGVSIVVDRTYTAETAHDVLTVQVVPAWIYDASYPCWIFSRSRLLRAFGEGVELVSSFEDTSASWTGPRGGFALSGFIFDQRR